MTAHDKGKGGPDKGHTTKFSPSKVVNYFPNFRSYFGMEYEQPWNMGKILLEHIYIYMYIYESAVFINGWKSQGVLEDVSDWKIPPF